MARTPEEVARNKKTDQRVQSLIGNKQIIPKEILSYERKN
ncbi:hypothetical protein EA82_02868 [Enterococcus hirae]|nr:hypothetical protein EA82_02868 [Enterococcus hirae]